MTNNRKIIFSIPFNNVNIFNQYQIASTPEWITYRLDIFMRYTLSSLLKQTNQNFIALIYCNPQTFDFISTTLKNYSPLPKNIRFIKPNETNEVLSDFLQDTNYLYEISLHSDDLYHKNFVEYLYHYKPLPETEVLLCQNGYMYHSPSNRLLPYFNFSSSFNCFIYLSADYLKGMRYPLVGSMSAIRLKHELLSDPWYINHAHNSNVAFSLDIELKRGQIKDIWAPHPNDRALIGYEILDDTLKKEILSSYM